MSQCHTVFNKKRDCGVLKKNSKNLYALMQLLHSFDNFEDSGYV